MSLMSGRALPPIPGSDRDRPMTSVDFLLPTGIMVPMACTPHSTLREVKEQLYQEARKYPLFSLLKDQGFYNFLGECRGVGGWAGRAPETDQRLHLVSRSQGGETGELLVSSPDLIRRVYHFMILKAIHTGVGFGSGIETSELPI